MATATYTEALAGTYEGKGTLTKVRLANVDILRGLVMVLMALDHTRDFFSTSATLFDPTDLTRTTAPLFFTRWITHFCAPSFIFLAGSAAYLWQDRGKEACDLAKFLASRGLWLILLEIFVVSPLGLTFNYSFAFTALQVIWVIGVSMILLSVFVLMWPPRVIGGVGLFLIVIHNLFDGAHAAWLRDATDLWRGLHQVTFFHVGPERIVASLYPVVPWVGVMMVGYAAGELLTLPSSRRRRIFLFLGAAATALFLLLRGWNVYGDPSPWSHGRNALYSVMSFLNCTKYPPSLLYLLMTLGPALILLALLDGSERAIWRPLEIFGRVPLFYYLIHLPLIHGAAVLYSFVAYGRADWLFRGVAVVPGFGPKFPSGYGFGLWGVYLVWLGSVVVLYPLCRWFAGVKRRRREWIFSYL